ncbi:hypothetical protein [Streptomyces wuyuanensis]|uniref:hypothetical protein n=1 Tax=Streptomyces wuyuanensis TaxID=1196353 RepID=UPI0034433CBA
MATQIVMNVPKSLQRVGAALPSGPSVQDAQVFLFDPLLSSCTLVLTPSGSSARRTSILVDCGVMGGRPNKSAALVSRLSGFLPKDEGSPVVDYLVLAGPDPAHTSALPALFSSTKVESVFHAGDPGLYIPAVRSAALACGGVFPPVHSDLEHPFVQHEGLAVYAAAVNATGNPSLSAPGNSLITAVVFGSFHMLLTSDATGPAWDLLDSNSRKPWEASGSDFLLAGHPSPTSLDRAPWGSLIDRGKARAGSELLASTLTAAALPAAYRAGAVVSRRATSTRRSTPALHLALC